MLLGERAERILHFVNSGGRKLVVLVSVCLEVNRPRDELVFCQVVVDRPSGTSLALVSTSIFTKESKPTENAGLPCQRGSRHVFGKSLMC